ncbi:MAG: DUF2585 family protein, partial [Acidobacteria bacterium]|nr:DUF2585 family protein [Acidobacteriota bacterium]
MSSAIIKTMVGRGLAIAALLGITVLALRWQGRLWWCAIGDWSPWAGDIGNRHTSQHLLDPYTFT